MIMRETEWLKKYAKEFLIAALNLALSSRNYSENHDKHNTNVCRFYGNEEETVMYILIEFGETVRLVIQNTIR